MCACVCVNRGVVDPLTMLLVFLLPNCHAHCGHTHPTLTSPTPTSQHTPAYIHAHTINSLTLLVFSLFPVCHAHHGLKWTQAGSCCTTLAWLSSCCYENQTSTITSMYISKINWNSICLFTTSFFNSQGVSSMCIK